ncbi:MAG TPA: hypothetical protein VL418_03830 [Devosiaceae bacterium]|nr:hypothetical protein [Devosiaceae bacterium]
MSAETALPQVERSVPRGAVLVAIPLAFALLGVLLRLAAYFEAGQEPTLSKFVDGLCKWDCVWYLRLATSGYDTFPPPTMIDAGNWAFFPLYPFIVGGVHALVQLPVMAVATALSFLLSSAAALVAWPLLERNLRAYTLYCAFLLCGPFSFYFTTFYTEAVFVLLTNCIMLALRRSSYVTAGALGGLLSASRLVGVFIAFSVALQYFFDYRKQGGALRGLPGQLWRQPEIVLAVLLTPLGLFAYMAYLHWQMGDALAFGHVQRAWGRLSGSPLAYLWEGIITWPKSGFWPSNTQWLALAAIGGLFATAILAVRRQYPMALFCFVALLLPMSAGLASMLRFVVALSPLVLLATSFLASWRATYVVALLAIVAGDYFFTVGWLEEWLPLV